MKIRELPIWEKPREKLLREGSESLSSTELIAVILRTGTTEKSAMGLASEVLSIDKRGIKHLADISPEELKAIKGMGDAKVCQLLAAVELGKRIATAMPEKLDRIACSDDIAGIYMEKLRYEKKEHFRCLLISAKGDIIEDREVSIGDLTSSQTHPREVFVAAVRRSAGSVAFVHNHPSGDPTPSPADVETTRRLMDAGAILGIPVIDHIIIGDGRYISMKAEGII